MSLSQYKVTSYNVLSSHLSEPTHFTKCKPEFCDPNYRLDLVLKKVNKEIQSNSIICLQEVSTKWAGVLHKHFANNNYHLVTGLYGSKFNGYMGVAIAFPLSKFQVESADITRIADTKWMPRKPKPTWLQQHITNLKNVLLSIARLFGYVPKQKADLWDDALYRTNQMICLKLLSKEDNKRFVVGTYHMPCMFKLPAVMVAHCALSAQYIQKYANGDPYIYTGDFNIKPNSSQYQLLTQGTLDTKHPDYPQSPEGDNWKPDLAEPLLSAYVVKNGQEPDFTNYAQTREDPVFIETLDYIFHSKHWKVNEVENLPKRDVVEGPLPNEQEPSDHILISANMSLD